MCVLLTATVITKVITCLGVDWAQKIVILAHYVWFTSFPTFSFKFGKDCLYLSHGKK